MVNIDEWTITKAVLEAQARCVNPRLKTILDGLVTHLHAFAREVQLSESEWHAGIQFLTEVGRFTDHKRQEFILLSDTLGLSMLVTALNNSKPAGYTESTVFGPFFVNDAPQFNNGDDIAVWQSDDEGFYDVQRAELDHPQARGSLRSLADGRFYFKSIVAAPYPIPNDGPVGKMLSAVGRHPWRPAHLHFMIKAPGYETLITHVFRAGGPYLDSDAVFGVRSSLIADWVRHEPGSPEPDGTSAITAFYTLNYDFKLFRIGTETRRAIGTSTVGPGSTILSSGNT